MVKAKEGIKVRAESSEVTLRSPPKLIRGVVDPLYYLRTYRRPASILKPNLQYGLLAGHPCQSGLSSTRPEDHLPRSGNLGVSLPLFPTDLGDELKDSLKLQRDKMKQYQKRVSSHLVDYNEAELMG